MSNARLGAFINDLREREPYPNWITDLERAQIEHEMAVWTEIVRREKPLWKRILNRVFGRV